MPHYGLSYTDRYLFWYNVPEIAKMNPTELMDWLMVYVYHPKIN
jgi:hypothetical protein